MILGLDTATPSTVVAVYDPATGTAVERRDDPAPGERPQHASRLLELAEDALTAAGADWDAVTRLAVGTGPGGFTGLRIGIATARALAQARDLEVVGVSTLDALAAGIACDGPVAAVIDARRGEAFAATYDAARRRLTAPQALAPDALAELAAGLLAAGDGAIHFREQLERAGAAVPADGDPAHRVSAVHLCRLGAAGAPADREALVPDYVRDPDAKPPPR
jgi:tRNA threonylcarbamoyladenosine biosynthesis protein TsaB